MLSFLKIIFFVSFFIVINSCGLSISTMNGESNPVNDVAVTEVKSVVELYGELKICSFNIQFLGHFKSRDNETLGNILSQYDLVVIQEMVAPPVDGEFPNGETYKADKESGDFHLKMLDLGFSYWLSEEDTGPTMNHVNSSSSEWWVTYYRPEIVMPDSVNRAYGFLDTTLTENASFERVPYAFPFKSAIDSTNFTLISVHLKPGGSLSDQSRREEELNAINQWISRRGEDNKDFITLGDFSIKNKAELSNLLLELRISDSLQLFSLNNDCLSTNTKFYELASKGKPYDHVFFSSATYEDLADSSFVVVNLMEEIKPFYSSETVFPFLPYEHNLFRTNFSDHMPISFRIILGKDTD